MTMTSQPKVRALMPSSYASSPLWVDSFSAMTRV
ncbi:hypothetical protein L914_05055 [Phytophthora nicotianae]|uniref:Uncharacterized protein n=1 Tax=Phytophthora nicotianae TaxID=4792 RepID=W2NQV6_PHYNI|nr:hypothetical protein L916_05060 [Phytophthora nicotianae]ETM51011.1 hypothetical protein L914_05055 [Phytophthora nicotianae]